MTREIIIPQSYIRVINVKKKRVNAPVSLKKKNNSLIKRENVTPAIRKTQIVKVKRVSKRVGIILFRIFCAVIYAVLSVIEAFNYAWLCMEEKCGDAVRKMGTEGLFGEAKDGYYHTEDGFRLSASAVTVVNRKNKSGIF